MTQKSTIICVMRKGSKKPQSVASKVFSRITGHGKGWVFSPAHFKGLGSRTAVESALRRCKSDGTIRQLARGLYDYPKKHPKIGFMTPSPECVAQALATRDATRLQPSGAYAANLLGLSEQVPAKVVFLTDGPSRRVKIGRQEIVLKNTTPRNMATAGKASGTVIQALRHMGKKQISKQHAIHLRKVLKQEEKKQLLKDKIYAPGWMHPIIEQITG